MGDKTDVWQGTLALMVLKTLEMLGPLHGYGIARRIEMTSGDLLSVNYGTLYPALLKLEQEGYIDSGAISSTGRRTVLAEFWARSFRGGVTQRSLGKDFGRKPRMSNLRRECRERERSSIMRGIRAWFLRLRNFFSRERSAEQDFAAEMQSNLQLHIDENLRRGMSAEEARRNALMRLGGVAQTEEMVRDRRSLPWMESFAQDFRFALRMLLKNPGFTVTAVLILALGIGANTAMFSVVRAVLLRPLAYSQPDRIVRVATLWKKSGHQGQVSAPDFHDWHDQSSAFEHMAIYANYEIPVSVGSGANATAEFPMATMIASDFFECFGVTPVVGREFTPDELKVGSAGAAIISYGFAVRNFGEPKLALGKALVAEGKPLNVVGVMPPGFDFPEKTQVWITECIFGEETPSRSAHNYRVVGKLKDGVELAEAQTQMTAIGARLEAQYPDSNKTKSVAVTRLRDFLVSDYRLTLLVMLAAVGVVLLIACANLANMLLARAVGRIREIAIRAAIGAGRGRIVRQLVTESVVLALGAALVGVVVAY